MKQKFDCRLCIFLVNLNCSYSQNRRGSKTIVVYNSENKSMKNKIFAIILFCFTFAQVFGQKIYEDQWKKVAENYHSGQYKSNLPIILDIQKQAMKEENAIQLIRSLKAEFSIINQTYDDSQNDSTTKFFTKLQG